ncbi:MAG: HlyD family efflux transporter periplasmic adaptor subunit [Aquaticitalea sp.]
MKSIYILFLILPLMGCKQKTTDEDSKPTPIEVKATQVQAHDLTEYLTFNGTTQFQKKENIRSNVTGYISYMPFKIGDVVTAGQAFASVRTKEQDALAEAIKIDSSLAKFSHPIRINNNSSGVISMLNIQKNDYVAEGDTLATISQPNSLVIQVNVPFEYEDSVHIGTLCDILLQNNEMISAKITGKLPIIDAVAQSQTFLIALPNQQLPENLNVRVKIIYKEAPKAMSIPHEALQTNEMLTEFWVMKIHNDTLAIKESVSPMLKNDSIVQIESQSVKLNDWIVTEGSYQMQDSTLVKIKKQ